MSPSSLVVIASFLFATMGVCVKLASHRYGPGEIVMYRGIVGALAIALASRWRGPSLRTRVPGQHALRSFTGVVALCLWFYALGRLDLASAMTLNYTSSLWLAVFLLGAVALSRDKPAETGLAIVAVVGFVGVVLVLHPTIAQDQWRQGIAGLLSGVVSATGYLQVASLARAGEPESRIVFYFSIGSIVGGALLGSFSGWHAIDWQGGGALLAVGLLATVAQVLLTRAYAHGRTLVNASLQYLGIGFSFGFGVLLFDERVTWPAMAGMLLIVAAGVGATALRTRTTTPGAPQPRTWSRSPGGEEPLDLPQERA
jgi:S-adenosylmethionine uptake transporter